MQKFVGLWIAAALFGCGNKKETGSAAAGSAAAGGSAAGSATTGSAAGSAAAATPPPAAEPPPAAPAPTPAANLAPISADVLPKGEATPKTRVIIAPDFRYQVPQGFTPVDRGGTTAYTGTVEGFGKPATLTFWATSEPFKGNLDALVEREKKTADADGAEIGPVMVMVADNMKTGYAKRMTIRAKDRIELRTVVVHAGKAFIHHCATPNESNAWANVGSDCITRGLTFHVAPPALQPVAANPAGPAPETPNVVFMASKLEGTGRKKADVNPWLDDAIAPYVKPCLAKLKSGTTWEVAFEIGKDGSAGKVEVGDGDALVAPDDVTACAKKVIEAGQLAGKATGPVTVKAMFVIK